MHYEETRAGDTEGTQYSAIWIMLYCGGLGCIFSSFKKKDSPVVVARSARQIGVGGKVECLFSPPSAEAAAYAM